MLFNLCNLIQNYKLNIKGVIQAGAHYGQEIEDFLKNDITNIVCFEPCPEAFEKLKTKSAAELTVDIVAAKEKVWQIGRNVAAGKHKNVREVSELKADIARMMTLVNSKLEIQNSKL